MFIPVYFHYFLLFVYIKGKANLKIINSEIEKLIKAQNCPSEICQNVKAYVDNVDAENETSMGMRAILWDKICNLLLYLSMILVPFVFWNKMLNILDSLDYLFQIL